MQPEVVEAVGALREKGMLGDPPASHLLRVARGDLVSVRLEIRTLLYLGVLLLTTGVGLFLKENQNRIGPAAIASGLGLSAAACFVWVLRHAARFTWGRSPDPGVAHDYVLLLGLLLVASDLAYVEVHFRVFGPDWPFHLLAVSLLCLMAAFRWDSAVALGLALTSFAAWRGVSVNVLRGALGEGRPEETRWNAIVCGLAFVAIGVALVRAGKKPHFEEVWVNFGLLLLLGGLLSGVFGGQTLWGVWLAALVAVSAVVVWRAFRAGKTLYFAEGVVAAYLGSLRLLFEAFRTLHSGSAFSFVVAASAAGVLALIVAAHRRMKAP
ncbi:MAG TPA: DUF2157 domain-containing protein [Thermoanaerobaculia bacterium]|nr:DUF2157 domain-containing protein [Thermoanaerobaculia bacterium]